MPNLGKILKVDLTERKIETEPTSSYFRDYIGGLGIGTKIMWDNVSPDVPGLDPKNAVIFSTGPLTGTLLGNKSVVIAKSPLFTNYVMQNAGMGGQFPSEMRFAGYDHIVITGKSEEPVYLSINNDEVEIRDAKHIWGSDVYKTQTMIKEELKDPDVQIAAIGQAGENQVAFALIVHDINHTPAKGGYGAVMGSKNLKAVAVRGTKGLKIADPEKFMEIWNQYWEYYTKGDGKLSLKLIHEGGIGVHADHYTKKDMHAWGNFDSFVVPELTKEEQTRTFQENHLVGAIGCAFCPAQCHQNYLVEGLGGGITCGVYSGFRWLVKIKDTNKWWRLNQLCQTHGMDVYSAAAITAWLMDLYEHGVITAEDTDGIPMEWGSEEACRAVIEKTAKGEGFGKILRDGNVPAAEKIGRDSIDYAVHYRNNNIFPGFAPIGGTAGIYQIPGGSEVWVHPTEADTHAIYPWLADELGISEEEGKKKIFDWVSDFAERTTGKRDSWKEDNFEDFADYAVVNEKAIAVSDISGHCDWLSDRVPSLLFWWGEDEIAPAISAVTGMECTPELMVDAHKRRRLLEYTHMKMSAAAFNIDDGMPMKLVMPRPDGQYAGAEFEFEKLPQVIIGYFKHMGIDPDTHMPLRKELERLGLNDVADLLEEKGMIEKQADPEEAKPKQKKRKKAEKVN